MGAGKLKRAGSKIAEGGQKQEPNQRGGNEMNGQG
jgi:hypothetical protein